MISWFSHKIEPTPETRFFQVGIAHSVNNGVPENACTIKSPYLDEAGSAFFALYEGHRNALDVSRTSAAYLHELLRQNILSSGQAPDLRRCFENAFARMDDDLKTIAVDRGTAATACVVRKCRNKLRLHVSNVGSTLALLCRGEAPIRLTEDHTLTSETEKTRLAASNSYTNSHVRVRELLSSTRALGDHLLKGWVISKPHYFDCDLTPEDSFLLIITSNISAVLPDHEAVKLTHGSHPSHASSHLPIPSHMHALESIAVASLH
jgi:serine/threonine protein phosphatase PrpC